MVSIRYVQKDDKSFWFKLDQHLSEAEFDNKIRDKMGYVLVDGQNPAGILRYNLFWDNIPFCTMLFVDKEYQHRGYGRMLMDFWENEMKQLGHGMVMTSTQVDEDAQHFYRKMGYQDAGGLLIDIPGFEQPMEMFFTKAISKAI